MGQARSIGWFLALAALLFSGPALADGWFTPSATDVSVNRFLAPIFGAPFGGSAGAPIELALGILNAGALVLGGILAAYVLAIGTMQTAHDGEMLGKQWSSMWVPIRTSLGVALVVPLV